MTAEERRIANAALRAGSYDDHNQLVVAVATGVKLDPQKVESVLERIKIRQVLNCIATSKDVTVNSQYQKVSVRYDKGIDWTDED